MSMPMTIYKNKTIKGTNYNDISTNPGIYSAFASLPVPELYNFPVKPNFKPGFSNADRAIFSVETNKPDAVIYFRSRLVVVRYIQHNTLL